VLLSGAFVNERKKKLISANEAFEVVDGQNNVKNAEHIKASLQSEKLKQSTIDQSTLSVFGNLLHRLASCYHLIWVSQLLRNSATEQQPRQTCNKSPAARLRNNSPQQKSTCVIRVSAFCDRTASVFVF